MRVPVLTCLSLVEILEGGGAHVLAYDYVMVLK